MRKHDLLIILSLLISLFIYVFYRTEKTVINEMVMQIIPFNDFVELRQTVVHLLPLNEPIIYSLPEGLWVFCITLTSKPFYIQLRKKQVDCVFIPLAFVIGLELFQLIHLTNGRFDFMDILVSIFFWILANRFFSHINDKENIISPLNRKSMTFFASYGIVYLSHVLN